MSSINGLSSNDKIIIVLGETGAGKTHFINVAARQTNQKVGTNLSDCTKDINLIRVRDPAHNRDIVFVDTPGFNATYRGDGETLDIITTWLEKIRKAKIRLAGIMYLFRISDNRIGKTALTYLHVIRSLCGEEAIQNVSVLTTMWDQVKAPDGIRREHELENSFCKEVLEGCSVDRFNNSSHSAWEVVNKLLERKPCPTLPDSSTKKGSRSEAKKHIDRLNQDKKEGKKLIERLFGWIRSPK